MLSFLYSFLFASSILLINPWGNNPNPLGTSQGEIWMQPKVLVVVLIVGLNLGLILQHWLRHRVPPVINSSWRIALGLWLIYLGIGLIATLLSPFPWHSLWGHAVIGDGWLYWLLIAMFVLSNALVLQYKPSLFRAQLIGLILGGFILSLSIFPQMLDWRIDYTATSGSINRASPQLLTSMIWRKQMPIGLYSSRGYAAFVLAGIASLCILLSLRGWIKPVVAGVLCIPLCIALFCTQSRAGMVAFLIAIVYLILCLYRHSESQVKIPHYIIGLFLISFLGLLGYGVYRFLSVSPSDGLTQGNLFEVLEKNATGRLFLWELSLKGITERPVFGWGFNGFDIAHLFVGDWTGRLRSYVFRQPVISEIVKLNEFTFEYVGLNGGNYIGNKVNPKANNIVLDTTLSVGITGLLSYISLLGFCIWRVAKSSLWGLEVMVVAYLVFTLTWFESAQFTHLPWWVLSAGLASTRDFDAAKANLNAQTAAN